jgi:hypothetical protein
MAEEERDKSILSLQYRAGLLPAPVFLAVATLGSGMGWKCNLLVLPLLLRLRLRYTAAQCRLLVLLLRCGIKVTSL